MDLHGGEEYFKRWSGGPGIPGEGKGMSLHTKEVHNVCSEITGALVSNGCCNE